MDLDASAGSRLTSRKRILMLKAKISNLFCRTKLAIWPQMRDIRHFFRQAHRGQNVVKLLKNCAQIFKFPWGWVGGAAPQILKPGPRESSTKMTRRAGSLGKILISKSNRPDKGKCTMHGPTLFCTFGLVN